MAKQIPNPLLLAANSNMTNFLARQDRYVTHATFIKYTDRHVAYIHVTKSTDLGCPRNIFAVRTIMAIPVLTPPIW